MRSGTAPDSRLTFQPSRATQRVPATDWSRLFGDLVTHFSAFDRAEWRPERFGETIRDLIRPKCLAIPVGVPASSDRQLVWAHGFDLPSERFLPRGEDPFVWSMTTTGLSLFGGRTQACVTPFGIERGQTASLWVVSSRRGHALVMEQMFVAAAGAFFGWRQAIGGGAPPGSQPASPAPGRRTERSAGPPGALMTVTELDRQMPHKLALAVESATEAIRQTSRTLKSSVHRPSVYRNLWETILSGRVWSGTRQSTEGRPPL